MLLALQKILAKYRLYVNLIQSCTLHKNSHKLSSIAPIKKIRCQIGIYFKHGAINVGRHGMTFIPTKNFWLRNPNIIEHDKKIQEVIINELFFWTGLYTGLLWHQFQLNIILKFCLSIQWLNLFFLFFWKRRICSFYSAIAVCIRALLYRIWIYYFLFLQEIVKTIEFFLSNNHVTNFERNLVSCYGAQHFLQHVKKTSIWDLFFGSMELNLRLFLCRVLDWINYQGARLNPACILQEFSARPTKSPKSFGYWLQMMM